MATRALVITVSDRAFNGEYEDESGALAVKMMQEAGYDIEEARIVPDSVDMLRTEINEAVSDGVRIILTTGGTGVGPRDVTAEATKPKLKIELPFIPAAIAMRGLDQKPTALVTRGLAGVTSQEKGGVFIANMPGNPDGVKTAVEIIAPLAQHVIDQLDGKDHSH